MGSEALAHRSRRDIRRAFAPEASEEVLKFVDQIRNDIAFDKAVQHNVNTSLKDVDGILTLRVRATEDFVTAARQSTLRQRLRWLWSGSWA